MSADAQAHPASKLAAIKSTAGSLVKPGESELARWKRTFDKFAGQEVDGTK